MMISGYYQKLRVFVKDLNCSVICLYLLVSYWAAESLRSYYDSLYRMMRVNLAYFSYRLCSSRPFSFLSELPSSAKF